MGSTQARNDRELLGRLLRLRIQAYAPVDKGGLKGSVNYDVSAGGLVVGVGANYATFQELGTKSHYVAPVHARVLAWLDNAGGMAFSKGHKVKGVKAKKYMRKALDEMFGASKVKRS